MLFVIFPSLQQTDGCKGLVGKDHTTMRGFSFLFADFAISV